MQLTLMRCVHLIEAIVDWFGRFASWLLTGLVILVTINVTLRYIFNIGQVWLQELEWHLMAVTMLVGISYALLHDAHVKVDLIYDRFKPKTRNVIDIFAAIATMAVSLIVIDLTFSYVVQSYNYGESSPDPGGLQYRWILKSTMILGFALLAIQALAILIRKSFLIFKGVEIDK